MEGSMAGGVTHAKGHNVLHLETRKTVFEVERVSPTVFHVLGTSRKDREKLLSWADRQFQQLPNAEVPLLVGGTL